MKQILFLIFTFFLFGTTYGQFPSGVGGRGGSRQMTGRPSPMQPMQKTIKAKEAFEVISINTAAGLVTYDPKEVIKEVKIKKQEEELVMNQLLTAYNKEIIQIKQNHKVKLETLELTSLAQQKAAMERKDMKKIMEIDQYLYEELRPIKLEVAEAEKRLNSKIESSFSPKINKKWLHFLEKQKDELQEQLPKQNTLKPNFDSGLNNSMQ